MGCASGNYSNRRHICVRVALKALYIIGFLILFPIMLVFLIPVLFAIYGCEFAYKSLKRCS